MSIQENHNPFIMSNKVEISVIIATFNSAKLLPKVLKSLYYQNIDKKRYEVIFVDGGSTDGTLTLARRSGIEVIHNPRTEPVYGKYLGYTKAKGKYILYLDHDEVLESSSSLVKKYTVFKENSEVKAVIGAGYKNPPNYSFINEYINEFGDPFSFYIYRLSKNADYFLTEMKRRYSVLKDTDEYTLFRLYTAERMSIIELCAGGSMFDAAYMKSEFPDTLKNPALIPHFFYLMNTKKIIIAVTKNDALIHYSSDTFRKYLNKIKWRVKNNIFHVKTMGKAGFSGRLIYQSSKDKYRSYLYPLYVFSLLFPLMDSFYLVITRRKLLYMMHFPLSLYTGFFILYYFLLKSLSITYKLKSYDESKIISHSNNEEK